MSSDRTSRSDSDGRQNERVYVHNDEGDPRIANISGDTEGVYQLYPGDTNRTVSPTLYVPALLGGLVLLVIPEPITTTIGVALLLVGAFVGAIDLLSSA